jgi:hypothetical protein
MGKGGYSYSESISYYTTKIMNDDELISQAKKGKTGIRMKDALGNTVNTYTLLSRVDDQSGRRI